ncbi:hypothetical protein CYPRO_1633 [Cyclonatronum proteinivorum]|uniref:DUF6922 domain-containing protein n=2 Tax=Cyclonatronum proteinivorum TaxID=1457365 RepID=A0A345UK82_9BACT|nr:hypothetical protein CYPRO_1633 [Cyclonatronum proteinivorum]
MSEEKTCPKTYLASLSPTLFWDIDRSKLDAEQSKRLIIERVFTRGSLDDLRATIAWYSKEQAGEVLTKLNYPDPKTLNLASIILDIPKEKFKYYTTTPSKERHWKS